MKKRIRSLLFVLALIVLCTGCGTNAFRNEARSEYKSQAASPNDARKGSSSGSEASVYRSAMDKIRNGDAAEGFRTLAEIPYYEDARSYLLGYEAVEYFLGTWKGVFSSDFRKGSDLFPKTWEVSFSLKGMTVEEYDSDASKNKYKITIPAAVSCDYSENGAAKQIRTTADAWILIDRGTGTGEERICFDVPGTNIYINIVEKSAQQSFCQFLDLNRVSKADVVNTFNCARQTTQVSESLGWRQNMKVAQETAAQQPSYSTGSSSPAVQKAVSYLRSSAFSRQGLIEQLEFEGFSHSDAVYGADHSGADWKQQAVLSAKSYLKSSAFSYEGMKDQLEFEGFTSSEAKYGADMCGANWNEQAVLMAQQYLRYMSFSRSDLIDQLVFEGFTRVQAEYGVGKAY